MGLVATNPKAATSTTIRRHARGGQEDEEEAHGLAQAAVAAAAK